MSRYGRAMHRAIRKQRWRALLVAVDRCTLWLTPEEMEAKRAEGWHFSHGWAYTPDFIERSVEGGRDAVAQIQKLFAGHDP